MAQNRKQRRMAWIKAEHAEAVRRYHAAPDRAVGAAAAHAHLSAYRRAQATELAARHLDRAASIAERGKAPAWYIDGAARIADQHAEFAETAGLDTTQPRYRRRDHPVPRGRPKGVA